MARLILNGGEKTEDAFVNGRRGSDRAMRCAINCKAFDAVGVGVGMKGVMNKTTNGMQKAGNPSRDGAIIDERHSRVQLDLVVRYVLGRIHVDGLLPSHRVLPRGDARAFPPYQKPIQESESVNESVTVSGAVRALENQVHDVDRDTLQGSK